MCTIKQRESYYLTKWIYIYIKLMIYGLNGNNSIECETMSDLQIAWCILRLWQPHGAMRAFDGFTTVLFGWWLNCYKQTNLYCVANYSGTLVRITRKEKPHYQETISPTLPKALKPDFAPWNQFWSVTVILNTRQLSTPWRASGTLLPVWSWK